MGRCGVELWGGIECTVRRIGNEYSDQLFRSGHQHRETDLDLIAALGIRKLRYPVLWERVAPHGLRTADWSWTDRRLQRLEELGIEPIVTLLHHGSGPQDTNLLDERFPEKLAEFARAVAQRYPHLRYFTPVNEPLTTARFSALYGLWYPHTRDDRSFISALLNELEGTARAMEAIRSVIPSAKLVQTEDLGKSYGTDRVVDQVEFENTRRWLSFDLLTGTFDRNPLQRAYFDSLGLLDLLDERRYICPPDILGINYYVTSERFLDERVELFPRLDGRGNDRQRYVDVEAVRIRPCGIAGLRELGAECAERYGLPLAVTEAHLNSTREEQVRWLERLYCDTVELQRSGADVRGFTVWSLLGAYDWNSLLVRNDDHYENGAFDVRFDPPRPTAIAAWMREKSGLPARIPLDEAHSSGWWERTSRLTYSPPDGVAIHHRQRQITNPRAIAIVGDGWLSRIFARACATRNLKAVRIPGNMPHGQIEDALREARAWLAIDLDDDNGIETARACSSARVRTMLCSSDAVFARPRDVPYRESDEPHAGGRGATTLAREIAALMFTNDPLIVRSGTLFGDPGGNDAVSLVARAFAGTHGDYDDDGEQFSLTYADDFVRWALDLAIDGETNVWHLVNAVGVRWADVLQTVVRGCGLSITPHDREAPGGACRAIESERGRFMRNAGEVFDEWNRTWADRLRAIETSRARAGIAGGSPAAMLRW